MFKIGQRTQDYLNLIVTHECNKSCEFCVDTRRGKEGHITWESAVKAVDSAVDEGIKDILVTGGEPTLHPDIIEIVKEIRNARIRPIMTTNYTRPDVIAQLDGWVDSFNISYYNQPQLPIQSGWRSDITIHTLIHARQLETKEKLDQFMEAHAHNGHLKFSTLSPVNDWAKLNQSVPYLDNLDCEWVVLFNEMAGQIYEGSVIKRYDKVLNLNAVQSYKAHVDGTISRDW